MPSQDPGALPPTSAATHNQASKSGFPLWADAEAKVQSQWLRKVTEGGIMLPVDPLGQTPAPLLLPGVKVLMPSLQTKKASYTDSESSDSF